MDLNLTFISNNDCFYTIREKIGLNNKNEIYKRTSIIYGKFIDETSFKYNRVYNGIIQNDGFTKYCSIKDLVKHDNNKIYRFTTYDEAKKFNDVLKEQNLKVPMKYNDKESIDKIINTIKK